MGIEDKFGRIFDNFKQNFFRTYKLGDPLKEHGENLKFSGIRLTPSFALAERYNVTDKLIRCIEQRMMEEENNLIFLLGGAGDDMGQGKSEGGQTLAMMCAEYYLRAHGIKISEENITRKVHISFDNAQFAEILPKLKEGDAHILDERIFLKGAEKINQARDIININTTNRAAQINFIYCDPKSIGNAVFNYRLKPMGKNKRNRVTRFLVYDVDEVLLGHVVLPLHEFEDFREDYKRRKRENYTNLRIAGGSKSAQLVTQSDKPLIDEIVDRAMAFEKTVPKMLVKYYDGLLNKIAMERNIIGLSDKKRDAIVTQAMMEHIERKRNRQITGGSEIIIAPPRGRIRFKKSFGDFFAKNSPDLGVTDGAEIVGEYLKGYSERDIADQFAIKRSTVRGAKNRARQKGVIWKVFEWYIASLLGVPDDLILRICAGNRHAPDIIWNGKIYSVKFRDQKGSSFFFRQDEKADLYQECEAAKQQNTTYSLVFANRFWGPSILMIEIDPRASNEVGVTRDMLYRKDLIFNYMWEKDKSTEEFLKETDETDEMINELENLENDELKKLQEAWNSLETG